MMAEGVQHRTVADCWASRDPGRGPPRSAPGSSVLGAIDTRAGLAPAAAGRGSSSLGARRVPPLIPRSDVRGGGYWGRSYSDESSHCRPWRTVAFERPSFQLEHREYRKHHAGRRGASHAPRWDLVSNLHCFRAGDEPITYRSLQSLFSGGFRDRIELAHSETHKGRLLESARSPSARRATRRGECIHLYARYFANSLVTISCGYLRDIR